MDALYDKYFGKKILLEEINGLLDGLDKQMNEKYGASSIEKFLINKIVSLNAIEEFVIFCKDLFVEIVEPTKISSHIYEFATEIV